MKFNTTNAIMGLIIVSVLVIPGVVRFYYSTPQPRIIYLIAMILITLIITVWITQLKLLDKKSNGE